MGSQIQQPTEQEALEALNLGQRRVALKIYQSLLRSKIGNPALMHLHISMIQGLLDNTDEQDKHVHLAVKLAPSNPSVLLDYGSYLFRTGKLTEARNHFTKVIGDSQLESQAYSNLAAVAIIEGNNDQAKIYLTKSLHANPDNSHALELKLKLLGNQLSHADVHEKLLSEYQKTNPSLLLTLLSHQLDGAGNAAVALECLEKAIEADPNNVVAQHGRAKILSRIGRSDEAIEQLLVSLAIKPNNVDLMLTMGYCLQQINEIDSAAYFYEQILEIEEVHSEASNLLACCYRLAGREEESIPVTTEALKHDPSHYKLLGNLASALRNVGKIDESLAVSKKILALNPLSSEGFQSYMFTQSILPRSQATEMLDVAKQYWKSYRESLLSQDKKWKVLANWQQLQSLHQKERPVSSGNRKIRVGILSAEIGAHVVGMFLRSFLQYYNKKEFHVILIIAHRRYEFQENELVELADGVLSLHGFNNLAAATAISDQRFDIIIETSGYTNNSQLHLLGFRLAPVQCHYIGYHASTGLDTIDYFIADSITVPLDFDASFSEILWRLPDTWLAISYREEPPIASSLAQVEQFTFGSFNQGAKFNLRTFTYWASALKSVPDSILVIKDRSLTSEKRKEWIGTSLELLGIPQSRLRFLTATQTLQQHMSIYNVVDACLDCTSWSGSTTVFDSLSMGTPYISIMGDSMASRMSSSILSGYGYTEWIASSPSEFADIAKRMFDQHQGIRAGKAAMQSRVLAMSKEKARSKTQQLETAFKQMIANSKLKTKKSAIHD
jgi:protein O-GlcNAc transferase